MKLNNLDKELIEAATKVAKDNSDRYSDLSMHTGCVVKAKSGKIYKGVNIKTSHSICAEQVAIGQALACGEREFDTIVAVKLNSDGSARVVSPCGVCKTPVRAPLFLSTCVTVKLNFSIIILSYYVLVDLL